MQVIYTNIIDQVDWCRIDFVAQLTSSVEMRSLYEIKLVILSVVVVSVRLNI